MRRRGLASRATAAAFEPLSGKEIPIIERLVSKSPNPEQLAGCWETQAMVEGHIDELSPVLRTVFVLRIVREYTTTEAAKILRVPVNTVKARLWRARRQLAGRVSRTLLYGVHAPQIAKGASREMAEQTSNYC
jgi:DNA-directed RNA polymerase specialized sigma24 family protein